MRSQSQFQEVLPAKQITLTQQTPSMKVVENSQAYMPKIYTQKPIMVSHYTHMDRELLPEPKKQEVKKAVQVELAIQTDAIPEPKPKIIIQ
jgi:hypothetical protein